jgi:nucleotide-binding universal stress UspA family protein
MAEPIGGVPIVVGVDGSEASSRAVRWAAGEARRLHAPLRIVHAVEPPAFYYTPGYVDTPGVIAKLRAEGKRIVAEAVEAVAAVSPGSTPATVLPTLAPAQALMAESRGARMLVLGITGLSAFPGLLVGSVPTLLTAHAHCPVAVIRGDGETSAGPVVSGIDGGPLTDAVLEAAFEEASHRRVPLVAVHAWSDADLDGALTEVRPYLGWEPVAEAERRVLSDNLVGWQEKYPDVAVERVAVRDRPRHLLLEWSRRAQLTVVGDRGRGGFTGMLVGSTSQALIQYGHGPLLIVRR